MSERKMIVRAGRIVPAHDSAVIENGAVLVKGNTIEAIGPSDQISAKYPEAETIGGDNFLMIPGLVNSHSHGRGLSDFQRGALDNTLESWQLDYRKYIPVETYDDVAYSAARLLKSGVTTTMHNHHHLFADPTAFEKDFDDALQAYADAGIRVQFNPGVRNDNMFVYGDNEAFLKSLPDSIREMLTRPMPEGSLGGENFVQAVKDLHKRTDGPMSKIGFGPLAPQWCTKELMLDVRKAADELGTPIHVHALQSVFQKYYGLRFLDKSLIAYMNDIGFLGERLVIGHCVWPTLEDISLLAQTGTSVTHHPSCNLRVRNGIAPAFHLMRSGVRVGIGLDGKSINDDDDFIQEMKICFLLHRLASLELDSDHPGAREIFKMGTENGAELLGFGKEAGRLEPGRRADLVLLDYNAMCAPFVDPSHDPIDVLLYRGVGRHVHTVMVDGRIVVEDGHLLTVDEEQLGRRLAESASRSRTPEEEDRAAMLDVLKEHLKAHYRGWSEKLDAAPYFKINSTLDGS